MRTLWCWRSKVDIPMLDDDEWAVLARAGASKDRAGAIEIPRSEAEARGLAQPRPAPPDVGAIGVWMWHLIAGYEMFTGIRETNVNAIPHHIASMYGPPCPACGKPLRTAKARLCAACGWGMA